MKIEQVLCLQNKERAIINHLNKINENNQYLENVRISVHDDRVYIHKNTNNKRKRAVLIIDAEQAVVDGFESDNGYMGYYIYYILEDIVYKMFFAEGTTAEFLQLEESSN